jgi:uncharacterized membrane protein YcaP (DUF421 family)
MHDYVGILFRSITSLLILLLIAKVLGKQTLSNMTFLDFVTSITLGAIAANYAFNLQLEWSLLLLALISISVTSFLLSMVSLHSHKLRMWISGSPTVLIERGKILENNMKKLRYTLDSLDQSLREKEIFDIDEVEYAVLEDNGKLSVLRKDEYRFVIKKDMRLRPNTLSFPVELIMDGQMMEEELTKNGMTKEWLEGELTKKGKQIADVFYAVRGTQQQLVFDFYEDEIKKPIDKE